MLEIFLGSLALSLIHALIPNHWIPLIALSKTEKWTNKQTLSATLITGFSHTLSTVIIGIIVGLIGYQLSEHYKNSTEIIAPAILLLIGIIYLILDFISSNHHRHHDHFNIADKSLNKNK